MLQIGFANKYYTLWDVSETINYKTDAYGKSWPIQKNTHYIYKQNISTDVEKVKEKYPNVQINKDLRGQYQSFKKSQKIQLPAEYFSFGKYEGQLLSEVVKNDVDYVIWFYKNAATSEQKTIIETFGIIKEQTTNQVQDISSIIPIKSGLNKLTVPRQIHGNVLSYNLSDNHNITLYFDKTKEYSYNGCNYELPVFEGKSIKIKNKELEYDLIVNETEYKNGVCYQDIFVKGISNVPLQKRYTILVVKNGTSNYVEEHGLLTNNEIDELVSNWEHDNNSNVIVVKDKFKYVELIEQLKSERFDEFGNFLGNEYKN